MQSSQRSSSIQVSYQLGAPHRHAVFLLSIAQVAHAQAIHLAAYIVQVLLGQHAVQRAVLHHKLHQRRPL